jgi:hypothetical protein
MPFPPGQSWIRNFELIGYLDLEGRPGFKMALHKAGSRWYLHVAMLWTSGWSIVEVTDPAHPRFVRFIEGPPNTWTLQIQIADNIAITSLERIVPGWGGLQDAPFEEGFYIWGLADPENPQLLGHYRTGGLGTHRNYYDGGTYVHTTALPHGYDGHIYQIVDISNPAKPKEISRWWRTGQWVAGGEAGVPFGTMLHGGAYVSGTRAYLPYSAGGFVILDISDVSAPKLVGDLTFSPPFQSFIAVHSAIPLTSRKLVVVNSEAIAENCDEPLGYAGIVDVSNESRPRLISLFPLPQPPEGASYRNFCQRGGRFGPHNQHQPQHQPILFQDENIVFLTYFNAGLRAYDISEERLPKEIGYFVPPDPIERRGPYPASKLVSQSEDVLVDSRGNAFVSDKNHGIYVLRLSRH